MKDESNAVKIEVDLTKPITVLIEKISNAAGVLYEPSKIRKKAKAEAQAKLVTARANAKANTIEERAIQRLVSEESRKQANIERVIEHTLPRLNFDALPDKLDNDWIANFFEKSKNISDKEMQDVWSRLLAGEANTPGSYSKRTVNMLSELDKRDALLFTDLTQFTLTVHATKIPYIRDLKNSLYSEANIDFERLQHLDSLGLINFDNTAGFKLEKYDSKGGRFLIEYCDNKAWVNIPKDKNTELSVGKVMYTQQGLELLRICSPQENVDFWRYVNEDLTSSGLNVEETIFI